MTMKRTADGSTYTDITVAKKTLDGVTYTDLTIAKRFDGVSWIDIPLPGGGGGGTSLSATVSPGYLENIYSTVAGSSAVTLTTGNATVTASGGSGAGPVYAWSQLSGDTGITILSPTSATTAFRSILSKNRSRGGVFRCAVTRGTETVYVQVTVYFEYTAGIPA